MGEPNAALNVYMSKKERIRDVIEYYTGGEIPPDFEICVEDGFYSLKDRKKLTSRNRDILKKVQTSDGKRFLLGIENQMTVNLTFPQRIFEMDSLEYKRQVEEIKNRNIKNKVKYSENDDFKYRFRKSDHIEPVFSLKLYWGNKKLEIPKSLKDMMDMEWIPKHFMSMFSDYEVHTLSMLEIPDEVLWKMESDIKYVVGVLKRTGAGRRYEQFILENKDYFERMPSDAYEVIRVCANIRGIEKYLESKEDNGKERVDMCRAIYEIKRDARREGKREGKKEGKIYGLRKGRCEAIFDLLENCGEIPKEIRTKINREKDVEKLKVWLKLAARAETIEEFCMAM